MFRVIGAGTLRKWVFGSLNARFGRGSSGRLHKPSVRFSRSLSNHLSPNQLSQLKPKPLKFQTILGLIILSSTFTMSFYLNYQLLNFVNSTDRTKSIFLPLWINLNKLFKSSYDISSLKYVNNCDVDHLTHTFDKRIHFKILNLLVNNKIVGINSFLNWNHIDLYQNHSNYNFNINCPTISGINIVAKKKADIEEQSVIDSFRNLNINYNWLIKLFDLNFFLLNQPVIKFNDLTYTFSTEYSLFDRTSNMNIGKVIIDGVVEDNNIMFGNVNMILDDREKEYKVL